MVLSTVYWAMIIFAGILVAIAAVMAIWAFFRFNSLRILSNKPVKATARLVKKAKRQQLRLIIKISQTIFTYWIHYEFKDSRGKAYPGKSKVTLEVFDVIKPGEGIDIVYDHDKPTRNFLESTLEQEKFKSLMLGLIGSVIAVLIAFLAIV